MPKGTGNTKTPIGVVYIQNLQIYSNYNIYLRDR